jgi:acetyltransferase-like isoleucine patch superfamily enzyme
MLQVEKRYNLIRKLSNKELYIIFLYKKLLKIYNVSFSIRSKVNFFEKFWKNFLIIISTIWNLTRYSHFFEKVGQGTYFYGVLKFSPDYREKLSVNIGENSFFYSNVSIRGRGKLTLGGCCSVNSGVIFGLTCDITIGNYVLIADNVSFRTADHIFSDINLPIAEQGENNGEICIEDDVWIGANVVILRGVKIGKGAIISANSVVNRNIDPYEIVRGVPIKFVKKRMGANSVKSQ